VNISNFSCAEKCEMRSGEWRAVESANLVSLRFCVLDNNISDNNCVLSFAGI
jgi:hypothetical protein